MRVANTLITSNDVDILRQSTNVAGAIAPPPPMSRRSTSLRSTMRSACVNGRPCSNTPLTMLNIAVLAPMPTASVKTTTVVKTGVLTQHAHRMPQIANEFIHVYQL